VDPADDIGSGQPLKGLLIGIDAGHQRKGNYGEEPQSPEPGSITKPKVSSGTAGKYSGIAEYQVNLDVALILQKKLSALGATVLMVRTTNDVNITNIERATMMNSAGADLVIRIHADGSENTSTYGASMLVPAKGTMPAVDASVQAGKIIMEHYIAATGAKDRGVVPRSDLTGFNWSQVPVCLIEMGYMSNKEEDYKLVDPAYQEKCASGLANGVVAWAKGR
jgi:N-acetylmuramoyl-L-alanine amidase